jgi:hypothetical protein
MRKPPRTPRGAAAAKVAEKAAVAVEAAEVTIVEPVQPEAEAPAAAEAAAASHPVETVTEEYTGPVPRKAPKAKESEVQPISPPRRVYIPPGAHGSLFDAPPASAARQPTEPEKKKDGPVLPIEARTALE